MIEPFSVGVFLTSSSPDNASSASALTRAVWVQHGGEHAWLPLFAEMLRGYGIELRYVAKLKEGHDAIKNSGMTSAFISPEAFAADVPIETEELVRLDETYGPPFIRQIARSDVHLNLLFGKDESKKHQVIARAYQFWEEYLRKNPTDAFLLRDSASFATRTALNIGRLRGIPVLRPDIGPDNNHFMIADMDENLMWSELIEKLKHPPRPLTDSEQKEIETLVDTRVTSRFGNQFAPTQGHSLANLARFLLESWRRERRIDFAEDPIAVAQQKMTRRFALQRTIGLRRLRSYPYSRPQPEKFVYMPLLYTREAINLAVVPFWSQNLVALVREVATALPEGWTFYVKEHPIVPGDIPLSDLDAMRAAPRVRVIHPHEPSVDLVRDAGAVITFQGSVGWEALLLKRPVIVIGGNPYYSYSDLVQRIDDIGDIGMALKRALREGAARFEQHPDEWAWFIHSVLESCPKGRYVIFEPPYIDMNEANAINVTAAIADKIRQTVDKTQQSEI